MSALWVRSAWEQDFAEEESRHPQVRPVEKAGYTGWVSAPYMHEEGDRPDHLNESLMDHVLSHSGDELRGMSRIGRVSLQRPVYATQSHVTETGLAKYADDPDHPDKANLPRFIHHQGRLYVDDGHHRVGAALLRGDKDITGYFYNADRQGFPEPKEKFW